VAALFVAGAFVPAWAMPGAMALDASRARAKGLNTFIETFLEAARGSSSDPETLADRIGSAPWIDRISLGAPRASG
jgi:hypothetical protein